MSLQERHPLPRIRDPALELQVFTHRSLTGLPKGQLEHPSPSEDNDRLSFFGSGVLHMFATAVTEEQLPYSRPGDLDKKRSLLISRGRIASLSDAYGLPKRLRVHGPQRKLIPENELAKVEVFQAYVGAIWKEAEYGGVEEWIEPLFTQELNEIRSILKADEEELVASFANARLGEPSERSAEKSPANPPPNPPAEPPAAGNYLAQFNQLCSQKNIRPNWTYDQGGVLHAPIFTATVQLPGEGVPIGSGEGASKKIAKEQAAQQALAALNRFC